MRIVFVGYFSYDTNYNRDLVLAFKKVIKKTDEIYLCGREDENVSDDKKPYVDKIWRRNWKYLYDVLNYIGQRKPDLVYLHQEFKTFGGLITAVIFPLLIVMLRLRKYKVVTTIHAVIAGNQIGKDFLDSFKIKDTYFTRFATLCFLKYYYYLSCRFVNNITVHTKGLKDILVKEYGSNPDKITVIASGVREVNNYSKIPRKPIIFDKFPFLKGKQMLLIFGFFSPRKGYEIVIKAFINLVKSKKISTNTILVIAGDVWKEYVGYKEKIEKMILSNNINKRIIITGYVSGDEIDELFRLAKIVILPAVITFNISGALAYALAYGKPVLAAGTGPLGNEVVDNKIGLTYRAGITESCQDNLRKILKDNRMLMKFSENSSRLAGHRYWSKIAIDHYKLFNKLVN